jgi:hypothetical protein
MALEVPETPDHPNKHPFSGIMTRIDQPSDAAPTGSKKRVLLTREAADKALPTLLGMAVDLKADLSGHDVKQKIGIITEAWIEGDALWIKGFLYAADFPEEVERIQSMKDELGFSWEIKNIFVKDVKADPWEITDCCFTGAAILEKKKAAYTTTSLAAQAEETIDMTTAEQILEQIKTLNDSFSARMDAIEAAQAETANAMQAGKEHMAKVEPHAAALESCAAAMEKDGIGGHATNGHVKACRAMADHLRAQAAMGKLADAWPGFGGFYAAANDTATAAPAKDNEEIKALRTEFADQLGALQTMLKDMQAAAKQQSPAPERKTLAPQVTSLLARAGITLPEGDKKLTVSEVDKTLAGCNLDNRQRLEVKNALSRSGLLAA